MSLALPDIIGLVSFGGFIAAKKTKGNNFM
jgi:hypothetical protein